MAYANKIFTNQSITSKYRSRERWNREYMISPQVAESLNTYRTGGIFPTNNDVGVIQWDENRETLPTKTGAPGVRSIFNKFSAVLTGGTGYATFSLGPGASQSSQAIEMTDLVTGQSGSTQFRISNNAPFLDAPKVRQDLKENSACSVKDLVQASAKGVFGRCVYSYSDFMYCKHLGKMPNNYMITLRRFPIPVTDAMLPVGVGRRSANDDTNSAKGAIPVGTMVTWMGVSGNNMSDILKYSYLMPYKEQNAQWNQVQNQGGGMSSQPTLANGIAGLMNPAAREAWKDGYKVPGIDNLASKYLGLGEGTYTKPDDHWDSNKIYGPIDRIKKNYQRSEEGIDWKWSPTITFEYELRSYNGINPKQAMLDLLASILAVTYTNGEFWKGGYTGFEYGTTSAYQNMNIFNRQGSFTGLMNNISSTLTQGTTAAKNALGLGSSNTQVSSDSLGSNIKTMLSKTGAVDMVYSGLLNKIGRPERYMYPTLLSEAPVGLWHLTIGNPRRPIIVSGNMVITNTEISHSGPLGLDDFPEQLKVTISLDRGKPRDIYGIEALYMKGNDRIFHSMSKEVLDMYASASAYKGGGNSTTLKSVASGSINSSTYENATEAGNLDAVTNDVLMEAFGDPDTNAIVMAASEQAEGYFNSLDYVEDTTTVNGASIQSGINRGITDIPTG